MARGESGGPPQDDSWVMFAEGTPEVGASDLITNAEIAPLLDALNERFMVVRSHRINFQPPMAGGVDIALVLEMTAGVISAAFLTSFFAEMGKDTYKTIRKEIRRLLVPRRRDRGYGTVETVEPFALVLGRLRFYFDSELSDEDLCERFAAARLYVESLPEDDFNGRPGPSEYGLRWNTVDGRWEGQTFPRRPKPTDSATGAA